MRPDLREVLRGRWAALGDRLRVGQVRDTGQWAAEGEAVLDAWSEPARVYHSVVHLHACLEELDTVRHLAEDSDLVELGLWYHDAVYAPLAADNEARSAEWAVRALDLVGLPELGPRLTALILATRHEAVPEEPDAGLLVDVDLAILGRSAPVYDAYERAVREEYAIVPEALFVAGRRRILAELLARPRLYATPEMARRYEAQARANLARALGALGG